MVNKIKLKKLKRISEKITNIKVNITMTTAINDERKAVVIFNKKNADIVINGNKIKEINDVIDGVAHELAHIVLNSKKHNDKFLSKWADIYSTVKIEYENNKKK